LKNAQPTTSDHTPRGFQRNLQAQPSLARSVTGDRFAATKFPTSHTAAVERKCKKQKRELYLQSSEVKNQILTSQLRQKEKETLHMWTLNEICFLAFFG